MTSPIEEIELVPNFHCDTVHSFVSRWNESWWISERNELLQAEQVSLAGPCIYLLLLVENYMLLSRSMNQSLTEAK